MKKTKIKKKKNNIKNEHLFNVRELILFLNEEVVTTNIIDFLEKYKENPEEIKVNDINSVVNTLSNRIISPITKGSSFEQKNKLLLKRLRDYQEQLNSLKKRATPTQKGIIDSTLQKIKTDEEEEKEIQKSIEKNQFKDFFWQKMKFAYRDYLAIKNDIREKLKQKLDPNFEQIVRVWDTDIYNIDNKEENYYKNFLNMLPNKEKVSFSCANFNSSEGDLCKKTIQDFADKKEKIVQRFLYPYIGKAVPKVASVKSREPAASSQDVGKSTSDLLGKVGSGIKGAFGRFRQLFTEYADVPDDVLLELFEKANIDEKVLLEITGYKLPSLKEAMEKEYD